jgi:alpha-beta hydrolase superfamily lysophospholipase
MMTEATAVGPRDLTVTSGDGTALRAWYWPRERPRGSLVIAHGLGEHAACYRHVAEALGPALELDVLATDFRGHGRSPGPRGVVRRYQELVDDLRATLEWVERARPGQPRFLLGHSNGGQVALRLLLDDPTAVAGLVLSNPCLKLAIQIPAWKLRLGSVLLRVAPGMTMRATASDEQMTRDPEHLAGRRGDPLRHSRISAPMFFGMIKGAPLLLARAAEVRVPLLMVLGAADPVVDTSTSRAVFDRLGSPDKTLIVYPNSLHEPLNDLDRPRVLADITAWLSARLGPLPGDS